MSLGTSMAFLQHLSSAPVARAMRFRTLTVACSSAAATLPSPPPPKKTSQLLLGMSEQELQQLAVDFGQERYRGKQLHCFLYKRKFKEIQEFSQLPLAFRNELEEAGWKVGRSPVHQSVTAADGTVKLLIKLDDNRLVETVGIPAEDAKGSVRLTACVSSQVGCPLRCSFCATGKGGFARNLKHHEIVDQVLAVEDVFQQRVSNVVFMGMGEPMLNLKEVIEAHRCLNKDIQIGQRMITISTVGVPNTIKKLASHKLQSTLAVSLHAPNQKLREKIIPSAKSYPLEAIMEDCRDYFRETNRRVSFEYTLLAGVNDSVDHATELAELLQKWGSGYHVNLIPFNPVEGSEFKRPYRKSICQLTDLFLAYEKDPRVKLLIIKGNGRAFSSGGDVVTLVRDCLEGNQRKGAELIAKIFTLHYLVATASKPQVSILNGIVMGGGAGISVHGRFRVATENTIFAMPETAIGIFPDVAALYFLSRHPGFFGEYAAITGARLDGAEMLVFGLATHFVPSERLSALEEALIEADTSDPDIICTVINKFAVVPNLKEGSVFYRSRTINSCFSRETVEEIISALEMEVASKTDDWILATIDSLKKASPSSLKISLRSMREARLEGFCKCLVRQHTLIVHVLMGKISKDFFEGCRAMMIDKDRNPMWNPSRLQLVTDDMVDEYFVKIEDELKLPRRHDLSAYAMAKF